MPHSHRVISFHYTLTDPKGKTLDSSHGEKPLSYIEGLKQIIPGLEKGLQNLKVNDQKKLTIPASEAYGSWDKRFVMEVPLEKLPEGNVKVGDQFQSGEDGETHPFMVTEVTSTHATLDANHPLAGIDLTFDVQIVDIREATREEVDHGHVHGSDDEKNH